MHESIRLVVMITFLSSLCLVCGSGAAQDDHEPRGGDAGHAAGGVELSEARLAEAGVTVIPLVRRSLAGEIAAPGEVVINAYRSSHVTPRISAQVVERHARLGDTVEQGQPLISLSSVDMAEAQGKLLVTIREWQRVDKLGREVVSDRRYVEAEVAYQQARARVLAYGMTTTQVEALVDKENVAASTGLFDLLAPQAGTVIADDFVIGEFVEPGRTLFRLTDESVIWVETSLTPEEAAGIEPGSKALVGSEGEWLQGTVIQSHHALNESTRTLNVRIEVPNPEERLHAGLFVETRIQAGPAVEALALPQQAVLRGPDGDWVVYVEEEPGIYRPVEIEIVRVLQGLVVIEGPPEGTRVVTEGAFFVQSELAKGGFEVHSH